AARDRVGQGMLSVRSIRKAYAVQPVTVSRESWHYRAYCFVHDPAPLWVDKRVMREGRTERKQKEPSAICGYVWSIALWPVGLWFWLLLSLCVAIIVALVVLIRSVWLVVSYSAGLLDGVLPDNI